eukprot:gene8079-8910_t
MSITPPSSYQDVGFLTIFPLISPSAVLDYFATSPFFDNNSNNQALRTQQIPQLPHHLSQMTGIEYQVEERLSSPPRLFVIVKQFRKSVNRTDFLEAFYCLDGVIYQCPSLMDVIRVRFSKIAHSIEKSFEIVCAAEKSMKAVGSNSNSSDNQSSSSPSATITVMTDS